MNQFMKILKNQIKACVITTIIDHMTDFKSCSEMQNQESSNIF